MPVLRNRSVFELAREIKVFLRIEFGLIRGQVPDFKTSESQLRACIRELDQAGEQIARQSRRIEQLGNSARSAPDAGFEAGVKPENLVWIFGSARVGSTWLARMMGGLKGHSVWNEPLVGALFGKYYYLGAGKDRRDDKNFILGGDRKVWTGSIRSLVLEGAQSRFPGLGEEGYLVVKEPNGSIGAPLLMEALPESRVVFLVRDPRDAVASALDARREGGWHQQAKAKGSSRPAVSVERLANSYLQNMGGAKSAYEAHTGRKVLVKYEDLRTDTLDTMRRIYSRLGIAVNDNELSETIERHAWENIPVEDKGEGKFHRKATPGGWREDLTPTQARKVEEITAPLLEEFYLK